MVQPDNRNQDNQLTEVRNQQLDDELPFKTIVQRLKKVFRKHIGKENAISMPNIFRAVYTDRKTNNKLQYIFRCQRICAVLTWMRKKTIFFIVGEYDQDDNYIWYVVKTPEEAGEYKRSCDSKIKGLEYMKERCEFAVNEEFWRRL